MVIAGSPATGLSSFSLSSNETKSVAILVYNMQTGQVADKIYQGPLLPDQPYEGKIDAEKLANGTYYLYVRGNDFINLKPFVVAKP